jgi:indolepyruvate ferredoxin oxidoreductase
MAQVAAKLKDVSLEDKFTLEQGQTFISGLQALARIAIVQRRRDLAAGLNTGGFISGYRGSPLGALDRELARANRYYKDLDIVFMPGVNEDLAATAVWGTQQVGLLPGAKKDGVFGIWYGKSPGVDRSIDVMRHANANGTAPLGGVLAIVGDDHGCKSSTLACQSDHVLYAMQMPTLYPASLSEFVEYGLLGIAMSRYSGCWTALKVTSATVETSGTVDLDRERREILQPTDAEFAMPPGGLHIRMQDTPHDIDWRLQNYKAFACHAFARKNKIDRTVMDSPKPRFGIITAGKSYGDVRQALTDLGITEEVAREIGLRVYKVGMTWPLEPRGVRAFVEGLEEVLIVEEKREFIEYQLKQNIYNWEAGRRPPVIVGKYDENGEHLLPLDNDHSVGMVTHVIAKRIRRFYHNDKVEKALKFYADFHTREKDYMPPSSRKPYYCAGCPHNTSTKVPEGSFAMVGIGCHYMVQWMDRNSALCTQMGGEGVPWVGAAPFSETKHIFANLGDGTYFHSGVMAIRQAVAAKVNITYKILYNDAVAMTGGQSVDGEMPVYRVAQQCIAEGVSKCWIVTENPELYKDRRHIPDEVPVLPRQWMDNIQKEARETAGTTVIIYDQTCAAEKRRRRKRGKYPDPAKRVFINKAVCEACGDCSVQSNCMAVQPLETEYGRKRTINQSMCNKDFSCLKGFCPSFVTVLGGEPRKTRAQETEGMFNALPEPAVPEMGEHQPYNIMVTGIGGTGVLTVGALLGMAAHMEGKHCRVLDQTGLAQKGGEVLSHVRLARSLDDISTGHITTGGSDLLIACDIVASVGKAAHETLNPARTKAVINTDNTPVAEFVTNNRADFHHEQIKSEILSATREGGQHFVPASSYAMELMGDEIATNIFMLGYAWQLGLVPLKLESIEQAIELNDVAISANKRAFNFGRLAAHDPKSIERMLADIRAVQHEPVAQTLEEVIEKRKAYLTGYQNARYAARYANAIAGLKAAEEALETGSLAVTEAGARYYHKVLAYKDEYEVARLFTDGNFMEELKATFQGDYKLRFNLAPPIMEQMDPATGRPRKREFGAWMLPAFGVLAKFKFLRGTPFDIFGYHHDRRAERQLIADYEADIALVKAKLHRDNLDICAELLSVPDEIRGYGPIKEANLKKAMSRRAEMRAMLETGVTREPKKAA